MKFSSHKLLLLAVLASSSLLAARSLHAQASPEDQALTRTITELDGKVFDAYNRCDLDAFGSYFVPDVEFYHDKGGATFDRATVVANTRKYICGKVRRELLPATLHIYAIKDYGAIEEGEHRFCETGTNQCDGIAKFLMIWKTVNGKWQLTRVVSYGHRSMTEKELKSFPRP